MNQVSKKNLSKKKVSKKFQVCMNGFYNYINSLAISQLYYTSTNHRAIPLIHSFWLHVYYIRIPQAAYTSIPTSSFLPLEAIKQASN